ncbi:hypothetical protein TUM19329_06530 [Legionella antarctica]|uniref:Lipoprotein n=1 Tax=Legionella antarctica TaxID=2708020 RepID=A0A6F8T2Q0_9GAMM|nr:hypothetical protein [Legionella antarctica]BCA94292.1 hypothetical protein TUM19329_06530 [Legionella antarctica]
MKGLIVLGIFLLTTGCACRTTEIVQFRQVTVAPVVEPVILGIEYPGPMDVTTTTIDYY